MAGAACMGLAISGMHYTGMAAATFMPVEDLAAISAPVLSLDLLAIVVAVTSFVICGLFLLVLLPDRLDAKAAALARPAAAPLSQATAAAGPATHAGHVPEEPAGAMEAVCAAPPARLPVHRHGPTPPLATREHY